MNIIGLAAFYHEAACCLLQDGEVVGAAAEERFSRIKHDPALPVEAFRFCLQAGGIDITQIDALAYYESPDKKLDRQQTCGVPKSTVEDLVPSGAGLIEQILGEKLGYEGPILFFDHHLSHAASAFYFSGFRDAAILTVDGVGEWATTTYGLGKGAAIDLFEEVRFPHSLGLLYAAVTAYLGFRVNSGEYKVMGLAAYGQPRYVAQVYNLINPQEQGQYSLDMAYFDFVRGNQMYSPALCDLFGAPPRQPGAEITAFHCDVARSVQFVLEEILLDKVHYLASRVDSPNLCMAGGVALNCVANGRIVREGPFEKLFVQPAAGDAGGCLGAAALAHVHLTGERHSHMPLSHVYWGPAWTSEEVAAILLAAEIPADDFRQRQDRLLEKVVDGLESGQIVGWFQGAMEFGPRALGARSILSNPLLPGIRDRLNRLKGREMFRPFTPSVLAHHTAAHFDLDHLSLFMLETCPVRSPLALPGITHVDGSSRPQTVSAELNPRYAALLEAFYRRTGCPLLLNTSLNFRGEPIVCSPIDALLCMGRMGLDILVLNDFYIERTRLPDNWDVLCAGWQTQQQSAFTKHENMIHDYLYTFV